MNAAWVSALGPGRVKTLFGNSRSVDLVAFADGGQRFSGHFALIVAMSGWMPMMFMTRVKL